MKHAITYDVPSHDGDKFKWKGNVGTCDMSDLGPRWACQVWSDDLAVGFKVISKKTCKIKLFVHCPDSDMFGEGYRELYARAFKAHDKSGVTIFVYND